MKKNKNDIIITEAEDERRSCYRIETSAAVYLLDRRAGGFTSIIDPDGNDWIGYRPEPSGVPGGAAGVFRGLPNMVHGQDPVFDGCGHPGFDVAECTAAGTAVRCSAAGVWEWTWEFHHDRAVMDLTGIQSGKTYWFLYEGPPGGNITMDDLSPNFWGNNVDGRMNDSPREQRVGNWEWVYFGRRGCPRVLYLKRQVPVVCDDSLWFMDAKTGNDGMAVFGFGRNGLDTQMSTPNRFTVGFLETVDHDEIVGRLFRMR